MKFNVNTKNILEYLFQIPEINESIENDIEFELEDFRKLMLNQEIIGEKYYPAEVSEIYFSLISTVRDNIELDYILSKKIKALLRQIRLYCTASITVLNFYRQQLFKSITLLFGLCCSNASYVFDAIISSGSTRIPSL